jgi:hypothetical protein
MTTDEAEAAEEAEEAEEERRSIEWHAQHGATCLFENIVNLIAVGGRSRRTPKDVAAHLIGRFNPKFWDDDEDPLTPERLKACADVLAECSRLLKAKEETRSWKP